MRNIMAHVSHMQKATFTAKLSTIWWLQSANKRAIQAPRMLIEESEQRFPDTTRVLTERLEDALRFLTVPYFDHRTLPSGNRQRIRVVGIFPAMDIYLRLVITYLIEYAEEQPTGQCCVKPLLVEEQQAAL